MELLKKEILSGRIKDNIDGLKFVLKEGGMPITYIEVVDSLIKGQKIVIDGKMNRQLSSIHKVKKYEIRLLQHENN